MGPKFPLRIHNKCEIIAEEQRRMLKFRYNPLNAGHIRVLHLLPGEKHQDIQCRLEDLVLYPETAEFSAPSYTWGDGTQEHHTIYIQENVEKGCHTDMRPVITALQVRQNLYYALTALHRPDKVRKLWIDAICIYQDRYRSKCCRNLRFEPRFL
jgi:Heterokaryon incompatibility protein (HET)